MLLLIFMAGFPTLLNLPTRALCVNANVCVCLTNGPKKKKRELRSRSRLVTKTWDYQKLGLPNQIKNNYSGVLTFI